MAVPIFRVHMPEGIGATVAMTLHSGYIAQGEKVARFEAGLATYLGSARVCAVSDSSSALTLALYIAGVRPDSEVIVSPMSCLATTMPIANLFARPVWCDVDPSTGMPDASRIEPLISERTRAIILYHWSGNVADLAAISHLARSRGIKLIADASEAFGAEFDSRRLGPPEADFTVYSFSAVRHITSGEGAALVISEPRDFDGARMQRRYGIDPTSFRLPGGDLNPASDISVAGFSFAMNDIDATIGLAQLPHAEDIVRRHRENGRYYDIALSGVGGLTLLRQTPGTASAYWTYSMRAERRPDLVRKLHEYGIGAQRLHVRNDRYGCFSACRRDNALPGVDAFDADNLSIPCGWWLSAEHRASIVACIRGGW